VSRHKALYTSLPLLNTRSASNGLLVRPPHSPAARRERRRFTISECSNLTWLGQPGRPWNSDLCECLQVPASRRDDTS